jgi:hypothetical protein
MGARARARRFGGMSETRASFQGSPISDAQRAVPVYPEDHLRCAASRVRAWLLAAPVFCVT